MPGPRSERLLFNSYVDHLNTPRLVANDAQQAVWRWDQQEPFGVNVPDENPFALGIFQFPLAFVGTYRDTETGNLYNARRDLDTTRAQYLEGDPIGLKGGSFSLYTHVANNPLTNIDPLGLTIYVCNRRVVWYLGGVGNHSYFWNDQTGQCCGRNQGKDPLATCKENGPPGGDACVPVAGSAGNENPIMSCCQQRANEGPFRPPSNDCHVSIANCLNQVGLPNPGAPGGRMGSCASCWRSPIIPPSLNIMAP